jgi:RNA polymerase sigma-70 factor (ECF subfamily)
MDAADDADLMYRFQSERDYEAFQRLFMRHKDALLRFLLRLAGERAIAEDASQHTWLKAIDVARQGTFEVRAGVTFRTWLYTLARNYFIDEYHRKAAYARAVPLADEVPEHARDQFPLPVDPIEALHERQLSQHLNAALHRLPFEQREVIALWAAGVDLDTIVTMVGAPRDTILSRKKYALAKLRTALIELGVEARLA